MTYVLELYPWALTSFDFGCWILVLVLVVGTTINIPVLVHLPCPMLREKCAFNIFF